MKKHKSFFVDFLRDVELAEAKDDGRIRGRGGKAERAFIPILSTCSSSVVVRVHDSQLLMRRVLPNFDKSITGTWTNEPTDGHNLV